MPEKLSSSLDLAALQAYVAKFNQLEFVQSFGVRVEVPDDQTVKAIIDPLRPGHRGGLQTQAVNGGVLASLFDLALGMPGLLRSLPDKRTATVQLSMSFMRAVRGDRIETRAWIVRGGSGLLFTEAETRDAEGNVCAIATGVCRMMEGLPAPREY